MRRVFIASLILALVGAAYACSFPGVRFIDAISEEAGADAALDSSIESAAPEASTEAGRDADGTDADAASDADARDADALPIFDKDGGVVTPTTPDAGKVDASACVMCDCDGDGYSSNKDGGCQTAVAPLDCDDGDPRTHPNAGPYDIAAEAPRNGDWDCSGNVEKAIGENFECSAFSPPLLLGTACASRAGFVVVVPCGKSGTYITCKDPPLLGDGKCQRDRQGALTQACR